MASLKKRGGVYYAQWYVAGKQNRQSLGTSSVQIAKEKIRQLESSMARGADNPLPTRTPIPKILTAYVEHMKAVKTTNGHKVDLWYLREAFGPVCPALDLPDDDPRTHLAASCLEEISTAQISEFISRLVRERAYAPKTANRFR
jgi:hypothetical protein